MKKLFLKSFALVAMLLCGLTASASAVDWSTIEWAGDGAQGGALANKYKVYTPEGVKLVNIQKPGFATEDGFYITFPDAAFGEFRVDGVEMNYAIQGAGACLYVSNFTAKETEVQVMNVENSAVRWTLYVYYADGTASGSGEEKETIKPTMTSASLAEVSHNAAVINVAGTDKETEDGETIAVSKFKVVYGETTKTYTATDGKITITGLTPGKTYSFTIYAVDAAGNVSDNYATVEATTESLTYCDFATGHLGDANFGDANGRILLTLKLTAANKVQITVKPNTENGATKLLDYLYVAPSGAKAPTYTAGAHIEEGGETSMSVEVEYEALPATMNFHLEWSNPAWDGNWAMDVNGVTADMLCSDKTPTDMPAAVTPAQNMQKRIENGQLVIICDGVKYNVVGSVIEK